MTFTFAGRSLSLTCKHIGDRQVMNSFKDMKIEVKNQMAVAEAFF